MRPNVLISYVALIAINLISNFVIIPCHVQLLISATLTVYIGCHRSLLQEKVNILFCVLKLCMFVSILVSALSGRINETRGCYEISACCIGFLVRSLLSLQGMWTNLKVGDHQSSAAREFWPLPPLQICQTFEPEYINMLLKGYFLMIGTFAVAMTFYPFMQHFGKVFPVDMFCVLPLPRSVRLYFWLVVYRFTQSKPQMCCIWGAKLI